MQSSMLPVMMDIIMNKYPNPKIIQRMIPASYTGAQFPSFFKTSSSFPRHVKIDYNN